MDRPPRSRRSPPSEGAGQSVGAARRDRRWLAAWTVAIATVAALALAAEAWLRRLEYLPTVQDDKDLWALRYERIRSRPDAIALLGASRIQFAVDAAQVERATGRPTAMLAVNGHYPLAALRQLAEDESFTGLALVGIDSRGFNRAHWAMQQPWIDHWRSRWSLARRVHRLLLTPLQEAFVIARAPFAAANLARRALAGQGLPFNDYVVLRDDRVGFVDYRRSDVAAIRARRIADLEQYYRDHPAPAPETWLAALGPVAEWVRAIEARGGRVAFFREPVAGEHLALDEASYPRARYWDAYARTGTAPMLDFRDEPAFAGFALPDTSHVDGTDVPRFTAALLDALARRGIIASPR